VRVVTVASPTCVGCYNASTVSEEYYDGSCASRRYRTKTVTNPKSGSGCSSSTSYGSPYASPDCTGACRTAKTGDFSEGGISYIYTGPAGEYIAYPNPFCSNGCDWSAVYFTVLTCGGTNYITETFRDVCRNVFGDPC
jgi:hypothetical protein